VRFRGECLVYRAEVMRWRGEWSAAEHDAKAAADLLTMGGRPAAGAAFYQLGEICRLRGEFDDAEAAYARAHERGRRPQPGLSLLRLAQGDTAAASASIRNALAATSSRSARARLLTAAVEILIASAELDAAQTGVAELTTIAREIGTPLLRASAAHARAAMLIADGDVAAAAAPLLDLWRELEMPFEEAGTRVLMARVAEGRGDQDARRFEIDSAQRLFARLKAQPSLARIASSHARQEPAGGLSAREVQVLRELAAGKTNRAIAGRLFISEKTVARHVSNIFNKIGVSSRSAATAWAYQRSLV
jgi:DNA-binding CsgD family transcriptional regulator